jgi:hypothetical protein
MMRRHKHLRLKNKADQRRRLLSTRDRWLDELSRMERWIHRFRDKEVSAQ